MRVEGRVFRVGRHWASEVPILDVVSQGRTKKEALDMIADAVESTGSSFPRRAASSSYRRKPVSIGPDRIPPYQVRGRRVKNGMTGQNRRRYPAACCGVVHSLGNRPGFRLEVFPGTGEYFEVSSEDQSTLAAFLLRRARQRAGLSLAQVAERLGATSINAYARYGRADLPDHPETLGSFRGGHAAPGPGPGRERDVMVEATEPFVAACWPAHTHRSTPKLLGAERERNRLFSRSVSNCFKISGEILSIWQRTNSD